MKLKGKGILFRIILIIAFLSLAFFPVSVSALDLLQSRENREGLIRDRILIAQVDADEEDEDEDDEDEDDEDEDDEDEDEDDEDEDDEDEDEEDEEENILGKELYDAYCARCHGFEGDGKGDASNFTYPKPRDFVSGMFKFRSTPSGEPPVDEDLRLGILRGYPGTSMFGWEGKFSDEELEALIEYIKWEFSYEAFEIDTEPIEMGEPPPVSDELMTMGIEVYDKAKCWECHGKYGRGDGEKGWQENFKDDWGDKIWPTNLAHPWELRNGSSLEDLFRSVSTGLDGTPMPSFYDSYSEEQRWGLSYYLKSLQIERKFKSVLTIRKVQSLPSATDDRRWDKADFFDMKIEGKKVFGLPFISMITNMRVRGLYTGAEVAIMLEWLDKKPDKGDDGFPPDAIRLQFPVQSNFINIWSWSASDNLAVELNSNGSDITALIKQDKSDVKAVSSFNDGVYRLMFKRRLNTNNTNDIKFAVNRHIPFSVVAYDGKNREEGNRGAISVVRYIILKPGA